MDSTTYPSDVPGKFDLLFNGMLSSAEACIVRSNHEILSFLRWFLGAYLIVPPHFLLTFGPQYRSVNIHTVRLSVFIHPG